ncbi:MAG: YqeG family HAD IIIA-type phosphatase [Tepidanaerobacter acetatoxydans]|uniref:YqeG family HAD IIIA-type phosphatase n=1 Tax=Tepidanaerobacter TaxID=499228 RepID=UPI000AFF447A|nr:MULTISPECIES: YqeG family HAD IIIA-type phosphatase [Tepidanaerobacter]NLU11414.1 YqeG family HAD IIIA-type phosphatase [Tepidanaerobacter acetatoxydans]
MLKLFCPDLYIENIYKLDLQYIKRKNIKGILIDLDNTLLPWDSVYIEDRLMSWIQQCREEGISLCIISNNKYGRIKHCAEQLGIPAVFGSFKPFKKVFKRGLDILGTQAEQTAVLGDQIFTDILGAKRMGLFAILVKPINDKEFYWTKIIRKLENLLLKIMESKKLISLNR